jgi:hypothetical protein
MALFLSPIGGAGAQFFDNNGVPLAGGLLYTYVAGTSTPLATYTTPTGNIPNSNPIVLDSAGRPPQEIWLSDTSAYKFVLQNASLAQIWSFDNIVGINSSTQSFVLEEQVITATQGQTVFTLTTMEYQPGYNNLSVYVNGSKQIVNENYTETSATVVTFASGLNVGDIVEFITAIPATAGATTAADVSYSQGGTGSVVTTVEAKLQQYLSVKDFGATGNGTTDDTAAIQNALNAAQTQGANVYVPQGTYKLTSQITIPRGVGVLGTGYNGTPRWNATSSSWESIDIGSVFAIAWGSGGSSSANAAFTMTSYTTMDGCSFWYPNQSGDTLTPSQYPPTISLVSDSNEYQGKCFITTIQNCIFVNSWIAINATVEHEQLHISNVGVNAWLKGFVIDFSTDVDRIENIHFNASFSYIGNFPVNTSYNYAYLNSGVGITIGRADNIYINTGAIIGYSKGIYLTTIGSDTPSGVYVSNLDLEGQIYCLYADGYFQEIGLANCNFLPQQTALGSIPYGQDGIHLVGSGTPQKSATININGCYVSRATGWAAYINNCQYVNISDSFLDGGYNNEGSFTYSLGIYSSQVVSINNNTISVNPNNTNALLGYFSNSLNVTLLGNTLVGQQVSGSNLFYANTCTNVSILDSTVFNASYSGILGQTGSTNCFGENPINTQGSWTPVLHGFTGTPGVSAYYSQSGTQVFINIQINYFSHGGATNIPNTAYITGLPVGPFIDSAIPAVDTYTNTSYGNCSLQSGTSRLYMQAASGAEIYTISGSYFIAP